MNIKEAVTAPAVIMPGRLDVMPSGSPLWKRARSLGICVDRGLLTLEPEEFHLRKIFTVTIRAREGKEELWTQPFQSKAEALMLWRSMIGVERHDIARFPGIWQGGELEYLFSTVQFITATGASTYNFPIDFDSNNNKIECIGGGGGSPRGPGGGGGAYSKIVNFSRGPLTSCTVVVGAGGTCNNGVSGSATSGGGTWFNGTSLGASSVGAAGGSTGTDLSATGGAGGAAASGIGTTRFSGGNGNSLAPSPTPFSGGGGGGAAGPNGAGANSSGQSGGTADAGFGGSGGGLAQNGFNGTEFDASHGSGGGGGGANGTSGSTPATGGAGGRYGGGSSGGAQNFGTGVDGFGGGGFQGVIAVTYTPFAFTVPKRIRNFIEKRQGFIT